MKLRDDSLIAGISERDFWEMTPGEAVRACDAYGERRKDIAYFSYSTAMAVGGFVASMFGSGHAPTINEIYPELFPAEIREEAEHEARMSKSEANFIKFANAFNQRYEANGNRKSESENNG